MKNLLFLLSFILKIRLYFNVNYFFAFFVFWMLKTVRILYFLICCFLVDFKSTAKVRLESSLQEKFIVFLKFINKCVQYGRVKD